MESRRSYVRGESGGGGFVVVNLAGGAHAGGNGLRDWEVAEKDSENKQVGERDVPPAEPSCRGEGRRRRGEGSWRVEGHRPSLLADVIGVLSFTRKKTSRGQIEPLRT